MLKKPHRYDGEKRIREMGALMAGETVRLIRQATLVDHPALGHVHEDVPAAVRLPTPERIKEAGEWEKKGDATNRWEYVLAVDGAMRLYRDFKDNPVDTLPVHVIRVGDVAIATNPCEFYCQFGLDIKRRSTAGITMVSELTDGAQGYCPTMYAIMGGGYSGDPIAWSRLEPAAGDKMVDSASKQIRSLWK